MVEDVQLTLEIIADRRIRQLQLKTDSTELSDFKKTKRRIDFIASLSMNKAI